MNTSKAPIDAQERLAVLQRAERLGLENMKSRLETRQLGNSQATALFTVLVAVMGAAASYVVPQFGGRLPLLGCAVLAGLVWLFVVAAVLLLKCMNSESTPAHYNDPLNYVADNWGLEALIAHELKLLHERARELAELNHRRAVWLNRVRMALLATPAVMAVAGWVALSAA